MGKYTCLTCQIAFSELECQKEHLRTDWHLYNLKRKIVELPPVSYSTFEERVLSQKSKVNESISEQTYCQPCKKSFNSKKSYDNHANSKKHIENTKNMAARKDKEEKAHPTQTEQEVDSDEEEIEEVDSDEWEGEPIPETNCLFCCQSFKSMEKSIIHMTSTHSFFVPDLEYCVNLHGLINYLGSKVGCGYQCLWCNKSISKFLSLEAIQSHMRDKGHCMMKFEGETLLEYSCYYDYSSSYPDAGEEGVSPDDEVTPQTLDTFSYELVLPSGATVGHRSLLRYYKQRFRPNHSLAIYRPPPQSIHSIVMSHYKAMGWGGSSRNEVAKRVRDVRYIQHIKTKQWVDLGIKANKFQKHFRPQVPF